MADTIPSQPKKVNTPNPCGTCVGVFVVMIIFVVLYVVWALNSSNQKDQAITNSTPVQVTAGQLIAAYSGNTISGDNQYKGKFLEITGEVQNVDTTLGQPYVALSAGGENASNVLCSFDSSASSQLASLISGQTVTVEGIGDGASALGGSVMINNCSLVSSSPASSALPNPTTKQLSTPNKVAAPVSAPSPQASTPVTTWHTVATLSGSGQENTSPFTIKGSEWRVDWTETLTQDPASFCEGGGPCIVFVSIAPLGQVQEVDQFSMAQMTALGTVTGTSYLYDGAGSYHLDINPDFSPQWSVTVEDHY